ncbi:DUF1801 domain-containing protein [bacterium]|nr:DUF1801 domain-containing protein [bacterium]
MSRRADTGPADVDRYLARVEPRKRAALERLRAEIREAAPEATECLGYGMPAFRAGRLLVGYAAAARHCALYLYSDTAVADFADLLGDRDTGKGTIRFGPDAPLPADLVRALVEYRLAENEAVRGD